MGKSTNKLIGGFIGMNSGHISDCYSAVTMRGKALSGFCSENKGSIHTSLFCGKLHGSGKTKNSGLCTLQRGTLSHCFWFLKSKKKKDLYTDEALCLDPTALKEDTLPEVLSHWSLDSIWHLENSELMLRDDKEKSPFAPDPTFPIIELSNKHDLFNFMQSVNNGTAEPNTVYRLTCDIDLGSREWTPIGIDMHTPFSGKFDGAGYTIKNFHIDASEHPYAGFFGYLGENALVYNLTIDCMITGSGSYAGPICGENHGRIHNCISRAKTAPSRYTGGFTGHNAGYISQSCALGTVAPPFLPVFFWGPLLLLLLLTALLCGSFYLNMQGDAKPEIFAPIIIDPNAKPFEDPTLKPDPDKVSNTNATFIMNAEMTVSSSNYAGKIKLRCPEWSNRGFVATIRVTKEDLAAKGIQVQDALTTIYKTGLIKPGYGIDVITLSALPDGTKLPAGNYKFSVRFEFYNIKTNEKSAVDAVAPLDVVIH